MEFKPNHLVQDEHSLVQRENHPCSGFIKFVTSHPYIAVAILCLASTVITTSTSFGSLLPIFAIVPMLIVLFAEFLSEFISVQKTQQMTTAEKRWLCLCLSPHLQVR